MKKFTEDLEVEVRFLEVDVNGLKKRLFKLEAEDHGEDFLEEIIFYDRELKWQEYARKLVRVRKTKKGIFVTYKHQAVDSATGTEEIEFEVKDMRSFATEAVTKFLERVGLVAYRKQEKKRHTFKLDDVTIDIDTWPKVPTYVELEGPSEESLKKVAKLLKLDWSKAVFENPRALIKKYYKIPVETLKYFTFDRIE